MKNSTIPNVPTTNVRDFFTDIKKIYETCLANDMPFLNVAAYSKPGIGKSQGAEKMASTIDIRPILDAKGIEHNIKTVGISCKNIRTGQIFPTDIQGNPYNKELEDGEIKQSYSTPAHLPSNTIEGEYGILVLDEFNMSNPTIAGMFQQLLDSRKIGTTKIPKGWMVVLCMNLRSHGAHVNELSTANNSRILHYNVLEDVDAWAEDYAVPNNLDPLIISYLTRQAPQHLYVMPGAGEKAFPCPRTWDYVNTLLKAGMIDKVDSAIGEGVATTFRAYYELRHEMPNWEAIEKGDKNYKWTYEKSNISLPFAVLQTAISKSKKENVSAILKFVHFNLGTEYTQIFVNTFSTHLLKGSADESMFEIISEIAETELGEGINVPDIITRISKEIDEVNTSND